MMEPFRQQTALRMSNLRRQGERPLRRFVPPRGQRLTLDNVRGPWRPSGSVAGCGMFAVVWSTRVGDFWAPLHDFAEPDQLRLIDSCRWLDNYAGPPTEDVSRA